MSILPSVIISLLAAGAGDAIHAEAAVDGATLRITVQQPVDDEKAAEIIAWLQHTANTISRVYGRFPSPAATIIVTPARRRFHGSDAAVQFGMVTRGNGGTVQLYVNAERPIEEFYEDWTATHEFSHLMLPSLDSRHRWISEGFASYYQNVLQSRAGHYTPEMAWSRLVEGFERGRRSLPDKSPNEAAAGRSRGARMKVYWSGAALALMADVELRRRYRGKKTLDSVLGELQQCCLPTRRQWSGPRLFRKLDSFLDTPVFMPLYRRHANSNGFPDTAHLLTRLGVQVSGDSVQLSADAVLADLRAAISAPPHGTTKPAH